MVETLILIAAIWLPLSVIAGLLIARFIKVGQR